MRGSLQYAALEGEGREGKETRRGGIHVNIWLSHFIVQQIRTQHCKATLSTPLSKKKKKNNVNTLTLLNCTLKNDQVVKKDSYLYLQKNVVLWMYHSVYYTNLYYRKHLPYRMLKEF